jgi:hypothetical protein
MTRQEDEDVLAGIDLHKWRVPPSPSGQRAAILARALAPAPAPRGRRRVVAGVIGLVIANAAVAAIVAAWLVRAVPQQPAPAPAPVLPAGPLDDVRELRRKLDDVMAERARVIEEVERLAAEMREAERELAELRAKLDGKKPRRQRPPTPIDENVPGCDEVACVLNNYELPCCRRFDKARSGTGELMLASKPPARVLVDGKEVGYTPIGKLRLAAGRHKVTFELVGGTRHTYSISIEAGKTLRLVKDFSTP